MQAKRRESTPCARAPAGVGEAAPQPRRFGYSPSSSDCFARRLSAGLLFAAFGMAAAPHVALAQPPAANDARGAAPDSPAQAKPADQAGPAIATAAQLDDSGDKAKLSFDMSGPVKVTAFTLTGPDRIVIDMPETDFRLDPSVGAMAKAAPRGRALGRGRPAAALVASYRFGFFTAGKSRIVIDLAGPARIVRAGSETGAGGSTRLVIELARSDQAQFRRAAQASAEIIGRPAAAEDPLPAASEPDKKAALPTIVIDAGHGGVDCGAMANGIVEKNLVFEFAKLLQGELEATGRFKIIMTRDADVFVPLAQRVHIARDADAQLFVSIHADTLVEAAGVSGATFYTVSDRASDAEAARTAEKENQADAAAGLERQEDASGVSDILFDLTRRETRAYSHVFARTLANYWKVAGHLNKNPERSAGFRVLKAPDVPSVLIELGYMSSEKDATAFLSADWRAKTSQKIAEAIEAFFAARGNETKGSTVAPAAAPLSAATSDLKLRGANEVAGSSQ